jgi:hypothetical protein
MIKNFLLMPGPLALMMVLAFVYPIFTITSLRPHAYVRVLGHRVTTTEFWASGAGFWFLGISILCGIAAVMVPRRRPRGIPVLLLSFCATSIHALFLSALGEHSDFVRIEFVMYLVTILVMAIYFYKSSTVKAYFSAAN